MDDLLADDDLASTPDGLLHCLTALAEEAACLNLSRTFAALQDAVAACRAESELIRRGRPSGLPASLLH